MSQNHSVFTLSIKATATLVAMTLVTFLGATASAAGNTAGVVRTDGVAGDLVPVDILGTARVIAGGAVAAGARVEADAAGKAVTHASGVPVGVALEAATASGQVIEIALIPN